MLRLMDLAEVYVALGQERTVRLVRTISIGALKTYGVYKGIKIRSRLRKFNRRNLRSSAPKLWLRMRGGDSALAQELSQAVLVSNIPLIVYVLDLLQIEHDDKGFFTKDADYSSQLTAGWEGRVYEAAADRYSEDLVLLYINHLGWETETLGQPYLGPGAESTGADED